MAGQPGDELAHRCAVGHGLGGVVCDTFLTGRIYNKTEVWLSSGNYKSSGASCKGQFWWLVQVIFLRLSLHLKWEVISPGHVSPPALVFRV